MRIHAVISVLAPIPLFVASFLSVNYVEVFGVSAQLLVAICALVLGVLAVVSVCYTLKRMKNTIALFQIMAVVFLCAVLADAYVDRCEGCPLGLVDSCTEWIRNGTRQEGVDWRREETYEGLDGWKTVRDLPRCYEWGCDEDRICIPERVELVMAYKILLWVSLGGFSVASVLGLR